MNRDVRVTVSTVIALAVCILLQSTTPQPDSHQGRPSGSGAHRARFRVHAPRLEWSGRSRVSRPVFFEDLMNVSPLGFHSLMRTLIGYLYGIFAGNVFIDPFLMPMVLTVIATILKGVLSGIISAIFGIASSGFITFTGRLLDRGRLQRRPCAVPFCPPRPLSHLQAGGQGRSLMESAGRQQRRRFVFLTALVAGALDSSSCTFSGFRS